MTQQSGAGSPQQFCLRWNNYQTNLTNVFDQLLQSESFVDVTLACDGNSVKAHKMVLSACSPYFQTLFFDNPCHHPIVIMKDIKWPELKAAIEFMYKGEINVSQDQIGPLLKVAECLKIRGLADVNNEHELTSRPMSLQQDTANAIANSNNNAAIPGTSGASVSAGGSSGIGGNLHVPHVAAIPTVPQLHTRKKRRRISNERSPSVPSPDHNACMLGIVDHEIAGSLMLPELHHALGQQTSSSSTPRSIGSPGMPGITVSPQINLQELPLPLVLPLPPSNSSNSNIHGLVSHGHHVPGHVTPAGHSSSINHLAAHVQHQQQHHQEHHQRHQEHHRHEQQQQQQQQHHHHHHHHRQEHERRQEHHRQQQQQQQQAAHALNAQQAHQQQAQHLHHQQQLNALGVMDDLEIKPGIAEMIREEERAKLLESSHAWLGASTSNISDSYQYQLQSLWQKCWNTNSGLVHNLRFRERGPLKSWRPETMAEAIFSVLKEGLSLSQAARKYDIPYPTFVLYANRVHNMLGPSSDGGADLRPKGRGRPQRILLGVWPDEHIRGVIRTVVFRDGNIKEEPTPIYPSLTNYACNGPEGAVSPGTAAAAAVAAVAQGLRHQMCSMVAAAQSHQHDMIATNLSANFQAAVQVSQHHLNNNSPERTSSAGGTITTPNSTTVTTTNNNNNNSNTNNNNNNNSNSNNRNSPLMLVGLPSPGSGGGPPESPIEGSPLASPMVPLMDPAHIPSSVEVGIGVSGMTYKPPRSFISPRPENLFQEDIADLVKTAHSHKDKEKLPVKLEPLSESRSEQ